VGKCGLDASGSGQVPVAGYFEYDNEPLRFIRGRDLLE
jgi:hypothetical protein